jgi:hypothetical protein
VKTPGESSMPVMDTELPIIEFKNRKSVNLLEKKRSGAPRPGWRQSVGLALRRRNLGRTDWNEAPLSLLPRPLCLLFLNSLWSESVRPIGRNTWRVSSSVLGSGKCCYPFLSRALWWRARLLRDSQWSCTRAITDSCWQLPTCWKMLQHD